MSITAKTPNYRLGLWISFGIFILFILIDYFEKNPLICHADMDSLGGIWQKFIKLHKTPSIVVAAWFMLIWWFYQNFLHVKRIFQEFIFPLGIVIFTLLTGMIGFIKAGFLPVDSLFAAANLITLNSSVLGDFLGDKPTNFWIENARLTGGLFLIYAFVWALSRAMGTENFSRVRFWFYRNLSRKSFYVVIGNGEKAVALAIDLVSKHKKVAFLHQGFNENIEEILIYTDLWYMKGNASSKAGLLKTYFYLAERVYVIHDSDEENFRTIQEMDEICTDATIKQEITATSAWFVNLKDARKRSLLKNSLIRHQDRIQTFYVERNIARKLLHKNPIDGFNQSEKIAQVVILGFTEMAEALILQCLQVGHFTQGRYLKIKVYYTYQEAEKIKLFSKSHPELFRNEGIFTKDKVAALVQKYTFFQKNYRIIDFEELPTAESALVNPQFSLYELIKPYNKTSLYVCLDSGLDSASLLGTILHRVSYLKNLSKSNISIYCHYNFPDIEEEKEIERQLNELTKRQVEVKCFGNYQAECTVETIENEKNDHLAKQIALLYDKIHVSIKDENTRQEAEKALKNWNIEGIEDNWQKIKEIDRESNRQAANHAYVKFREFEKDITKLPKDLTNFWSDDLPTLAELEHRRWCAEKLLLGWLPTTDSELWETNKNTLRSQKLHLFLVPYDKLPEGEKLKDYTQVMGLPYFLRV